MGLTKTNFLVISLQKTIISCEKCPLIDTEVKEEQVLTGFPPMIKIPCCIITDKKKTVYCAYFNEFVFSEPMGGLLFDCALMKEKIDPYKSDRVAEGGC